VKKTQVGASVDIEIQGKGGESRKKKPLARLLDEEETRAMEKENRSGGGMTKGIRKSRRQ